MLKAGVIDADGAGRARLAMRSEGKPLDEAVISSRAATEDAAQLYFAQRFGVTQVDLSAYAPTKEFLKKLPVRILLKHRLIPVSQENGTVTVASARLFDTTGLDELRLATGLDFRLALAHTSEIDRWAGRYLGVGADTLETMANEEDASGRHRGARRRTARRRR